MTTKLLANQLQSILADPVEGFTVELADESSLFDWRVYIEGPRETCYEGGVFQLSLTFPRDYPMNPPVLKFMSDFWHPNVYTDGKVCMSILHPPGDDAMSGELARERWLPTQSVTTIVLSLLSLLNDPNCSSPANVDASVEWRKNRQSYIQKCKKLVERANREKPPHVVIPHPDTDENEHRKIVQKWKELNTGMDAAEFYEDDGGENDDDESESDESDSENEDEDDLVESNGEIDSEGEGEKREAKEKETKKDGAETAKTKESDSAPTVTSTQISNPATLPSSSSADRVATSSSTPRPSSSSTPVTLPSSSSQPLAPSPSPSSSSLPAASSSSSSSVVIEEISVEPSGPSGPNPGSNGPNPNNNNNNAEAPMAALPSGKKGKKEKGKKKKCIIM